MFRFAFLEEPEMDEVCAMLLTEEEVEMMVLSPRTPTKLAWAHVHPQEQEETPAPRAPHEVPEAPEASETPTDDDTACGSSDDEVRQIQGRSARPRTKKEPETDTSLMSATRCECTCICGGAGWIVLLTARGGALPHVRVHYDPVCACMKKVHLMYSNTPFVGCGESGYLNRTSDNVHFGPWGRDVPFVACTMPLCPCEGEGVVSTCAFEPTGPASLRRKRHEAFRVHLWSRCACEHKFHVVATKLSCDSTETADFNTRTMRDCVRRVIRQRKLKNKS